jgi:hypothetical protein
MRDSDGALWCGPVELLLGVDNYEPLRGTLLGEMHGQHMRGLGCGFEIRYQPSSIHAGRADDAFS